MWRKKYNLEVQGYGQVDNSDIRLTLRLEASTYLCIHTAICQPPSNL